MATLAELRGMSKSKLPSLKHSGGFVLPNVLIGVEVEVEHTAYVTDVPSVWDWTSDGSLRENGAEFVLSSPRRGASLRTALRKLEAALAPNGVRFSDRTSVHIHMDVRDLQTPEIAAIILAYVVVEPVLMRYCGASRENNIYCLPAYRANLPVNTVIDLLEGNAGLRSASTGTYKYAAINIASLFYLGTLEFRAHSGTCNAEAISRWINMLMSIRKFGIDMLSSIKNLPEHVSERGPVDLMEDIFGSVLTADVLTQANMNEEELYTNLMRGARLAQEIIHSRDIRNAYTHIQSLP